MSPRPICLHRVHGDKITRLAVVSCQIYAPLALPPTGGPSLPIELLALWAQVPSGRCK
jgi:hypothetical protein